jgi:hypothetical protein
MAFPGILTRGQFASGLQTKAICINGEYLLVESFDVNQVQETEVVNYIQGGPAYAIYNIGAKKYEGNITLPIRVDRDGNLIPAIKTLLQYAQRPMTALRIDTHHLLSHFEATVVDPGSDNNKNLSLDCVAITNLSLTASEGSEVKINISVTGMSDYNTESVFDFETDQLMGRVLTWADCSVFRKESSMRTTSSFEITIENQIVTPVFLMPFYVGAGVTKNDQIELIGIQSTKWSGNVVEVIRQGSDLETFIHGGFMHNQNLNLNIGPITTTFLHPVFKIAQNPLTSQVIRRTTSWIGINKPDASMNANGLFNFA